MKIKLLHPLGTIFNIDSTKTGDVLDVPDDEAKLMIKWGNAEAFKGKEEHATAPKGETATAATESDNGVISEPPHKAASKADWVEWAVEQGVDRDEAELLTKQQLIELSEG